MRRTIGNLITVMVIDQITDQSKEMSSLSSLLSFHFSDLTCEGKERERARERERAAQEGEAHGGWRW